MAVFNGVLLSHWGTLITGVLHVLNALNSALDGRYSLYSLAKMVLFSLAQFY